MCPFIPGRHSCSSLHRMEGEAVINMWSVPDIKYHLQIYRYLVAAAEEWKSNFVWFPRMHKFLVENPFLVIVASGILLIVIYFHWQVLDGQRKIIKLLNAQIMNEGDDKKFLIGKLKDFNKKKYIPLKRQMHEETEDWSSIKNKLSLRKAIHKMGLRSKLLPGMTQEEQILAEDFENWFYKRFYILQKCFLFRTRVYIQVSERKVKCSSDILHLIIQQTFIFKSHLLCIFQVK